MGALALAALVSCSDEEDIGAEYEPLSVDVNLSNT